MRTKRNEITKKKNKIKLFKLLLLSVGTRRMKSHYSRCAYSKVLSLSIGMQ